MHLRILIAATALAALAASAFAAGGPVVNPHVSTDTSVDFRTIDRIIASVVTEDMTDEQKILAVFHAMRRMWVHGPSPGRVAYDFHKVIHSIGTGACLTMTTPLHVVYERMGYKWAEGPKWKTPKSVSKTFAKDGKFEVEVPGPKWPRMQSLTLSVAP